MTTKIIPIIPLFSLQKNPTRSKSRLTAEGWKRRDLLIPRCALLQPSMSPFQVLYGGRNDQDPITLTGFSHVSFRYMLTAFEVFYNKETPYSADGCIRVVQEQNQGREGVVRCNTLLGLVPNGAHDQRAADNLMPDYWCLCFCGILFHSFLQGG